MSVKNATLSTFSPVTYVRMVAVVSLVVSLCSGVGYWQSGKKRKQKDQELQELEKRKDVEIEGLRHNLTETRAHLQANEDAMMALKGQIDRLRGSVIEAHRQSQDLHIEAEKLKEQVRAREEQGQAWKRELDTTKDKYKQTQDLLNTRSSELKAAQTFLMTTDKLSNVDVIKLVEALNAEILQTSALVADAFQFEAKAENGYEVSEELDEVLERATEIVGRRMVRLLTSAEHKEDPILVQIAIQAGLCAYAHWIISSWYFQGIENEQIQCTQ
ncbi:hypothetical protein AMATHDRAFT_67867 [Amanita thiersii Skay4041]|uniref:Uncharacterized protein n=1 Tax=Amanita thiersii Skay4041 TaxID=703135 RepID=A0A2A9NBD9_9AGAR|nr:hypothetical protein AMATHDRAFT_67867 [Amanita thiersii Skay4041]